MRPTSVGDIDVSAFDGPVIPASGWPAINVVGKRVGMIVATADGIDLVAHVVRRAHLVKVFHRHPVNVIPGPRLSRVRPVRRMQPLARGIAWLCRRLAIDDKEMRRQLSPSSERLVLRSHGWYRALGRENSQLISWPIARVTAQGVRTADGVEHLIDMLIVD